MSKPSKKKLTLMEDFPRGGVKKMPKKRKTKEPVQDLFKTNDGEKKPDHHQSGPKKKKFKPGNQKQQLSHYPPPQKGSSKLESLRFNHIEVGMHILCCVAKVGNYSLTMDLPGGLQGEVAITAISDTYTDQLSRLTSDDYEEDQEEEIAHLKDMFRPGLILPCEVTAIKIRSGSKKKIFLSMNPKLVNRHLEVEHLVEGMILFGSVRSREDHGYVLDVGVEGVTAFLADSRADKYITSVNEGESPKLGQVVMCTILSSKNKNIKVSINPKQVDNAQVTKSVMVVPGMKVSGTIQQVLKEGLVVEFDGQTCLVHQTHTPAYTLEKYTQGSKVKGTVLYRLLKNRTTHLSLLPHLSGATCGGLSDKFTTLTDRTTPHKARVLDAMDRIVWFTLDNGVRALATRPHLRAVATDMKTPLQKTFRVGEKHSCTVVGHNLMENVVHVHLSGKTETNKPSSGEKNEESLIQKRKLENMKSESSISKLKSDAESEPKSKKKKSEKGEKFSKDERNLKNVNGTYETENLSEKKKKKKSKSISDIKCETGDSEDTDNVKSAKKKKLKEIRKSAVDFAESESDESESDDSDDSDDEVTGTKKTKLETDYLKIQETKTKLKKKDKTNMEPSVKETPSKKVKAVKEELMKETPGKKDKTTKKTSVKETPLKKAKADKEESVKKTPAKKGTAGQEESVKDTPAKKTKADKLIKETPSRKEKAAKEKSSRETPGKKDKSVKETPSKKGKTKSTEESDSGVEVNKASDSDDDEDMKVPTVGANPPRLTMSAGFSFSEDFSIAPSGVNDVSSDDEVEEKKYVKKTPHELRQERIDEEKKIYAYERQQLEGDQIPVCSNDFDRLVLQSPDSSLLWTRYMAFHLETAEIDKARTVAERALKTISFREEQEKLNVWLAYMNLENMYGAEAQLTAVFDRALQQNDPVKVYRQMVQVYSNSGKMEEAEKMYNTMTKKFTQDKTVWTGFGLFFFKNGRPEAARKLLQRCLKSLDKKDHVELISKFAQMEYKQGEPQRGCTMFENVLTNYPKRTDLWSVYLDMVIKTGNLDDVRHLFERVIHMKMSSKKMQFFFKKYMDFEKKYGDSKSMEKVKQKALEYVESQGFTEAS
ncbi:protein RRP5 homolog isoform X1 [Haliotis rufescens]|uniref:protein RRP5 homolog isoform X1 n=1 Tax=Haliotis rufescens TaxID=6454 RepID=UPI00201F67A4|nr:protein RRP5 homolog isoform X1 [Haliotis rufescens]XP_048249314.1 protein RRP5 homolog isoform X1 [Haliotis rufescens]XP_048249315.1 protein RRP5 homolog isoform X1 [Haliotis rufescens]